MKAITETVTRPAHGDDRLALEITMLGGAAHHFEISAEGYYRALKQVLADPATRSCGMVEPIAHPSDFEPAGNPS